MNSSIGLSAVADAVSAAVAAATGWAGSLLVVTAAAGAAPPPLPPSSRRLAAAAAHANGAANGASEPSEPPANHAASELPTPETEPRAEVIDGADACAAAAAAGAEALVAAAARAEREAAGAGAAASTETSGASVETSGASTGEPLSSEPLVDGELSTSGADTGRLRLGVLVELRVSFLEAVPRPDELASAPASAVAASEPPREPLEVAGAAEAPRLAARVPRVDFVVGADWESVDTVLVEPLDPVTSAAATGIEATAAPTPSAIARAPTRPT